MRVTARPMSHFERRAARIPRLAGDALEEDMSKDRARHSPGSRVPAVSGHTGRSGPALTTQNARRRVEGATAHWGRRLNPSAAPVSNEL